MTQRGLGIPTITSNHAPEASLQIKLIDKVQLFQINTRVSTFREDFAMGCVPSQHEREEAALGPPSKTMDASEHAQDLVLLVRKPIQFNLCDGPMPPAHKIELKATQMIKRDVKSGIQDNGGTMYYIKCKITGLDKWPWVFVKIYEPELVTVATPVAFRGLKKMKEEYKLVTF